MRLSRHLLHSSGLLRSSRRFRPLQTSGLVQPNHPLPQRSGLPSRLLQGFRLPHAVRSLWPTLRRKLSGPPTWGRHQIRAPRRMLQLTRQPENTRERKNRHPPGDCRRGLKCLPRACPHPWKSPRDSTPFQACRALLEILPMSLRLMLVRFCRELLCHQRALRRTLRRSLRRSLVRAVGLAREGRRSR
jgi:hypothetical protein